MVFRTALPVCAALFALHLALSASPAAAQLRPIAAGQTVSARLTAGDAVLGDGSHYHLYVYRGQPGERIEITLRSGDFDAYLSGGRLDGAELIQDDFDDDGAGGTDARMTVTVAPGGSYAIRANTFAAGETGAYTLTVERVGGGAAPPGAAGALTIAAGETVRGRLEVTDPTLPDGSHYKLYQYRGQPGEQIVVVMRSPDFDAFLYGGTLQGADFSAEDSDDDGAGGTDALLAATVGPAGTYAIRANSLAGGSTGAFTLTVQATGGAATAGAARTLRVGETVAGRLQPSTPQLGDGSHYDRYYYDGRAGERLFISMASSDFDTYLRWGSERGGQFDLLDSDDDGGGGTNSRLEVTLAESGRYLIQANSFGAGETGAYTLTVESLSSVAGGLPAIALGQTLSGRLGPSDPVLGDNSHYQRFVYQGRPGERVMVTLRSRDFDAYLAVGRMVGGAFASTESDDDSGGGTDAQVLAAVGADGTLVIQANTYGTGETGAFTLAVDALGGAPIPQPLATPGRPTVSAGDRISGALQRTDPMMPDSSFYNEYVYGGSAGERLRFTLTSTDFDTYLRWGRLNGEQFSQEAHDDDGAGGTNSLLEVTVGGSGVYAIRVNSYDAEETGAYTLSVERLGAAEAPGAATSGSVGKWHYRYVDSSDPYLRSLAQRVKQARVLEQIAEDFSGRFLLPRDIDMRFDECGVSNAFYRPSLTEIVFCYELLEDLADLFLPASGVWTQEALDDVLGAVSFILMHEVGHALVDVLDLPITGREEDVADQLAVWTLVEGSEKGAQAAYAGALALQPERDMFSDLEYAGEHSLGPVRLYNVLCWVYGSDPWKYDGIVADGHLPEERAVRCPGEWDRMSKAWHRLLQPHVGRAFRR